MKRKVNGKVILQYAILVVLSFLAVFIGNKVTSRNAILFSSEVSEAMETYLVKVDSVLSVETHDASYGGVMQVTQTDIKFTGTILYGEKKGDSIVVTQTYDDVITTTGVPAEKGDWIYVHVTDGEARAGNFFRLKEIIFLFIVVILFLILFARLKGLASVVSLGLTIAAVFLVFIPAILSGYNVYLWAILICVYSIIITPLYVGGFNKKSLASVLGSFGGVFLAGILTLVMNSVMKITGFASEEDMFVVSILSEPIDLRAVTFAAIIIGALGSTLDVSMSIATSVWEMHDSSGNDDFRSLLDFGFNIGRDILGTQISTLVLAYIGTSLCTVLLLVAYQPSVLELMNLEQVIIQMEESLIGVATIILTIPFTALISAVMLSRREHEESFRINGGEDTSIGKKTIYTK